jgi:hypothetical protein
VGTDRELKSQVVWINGLVSPTTAFIIIPIPDRNRASRVTQEESNLRCIVIGTLHPMTSGHITCDREGRKAEGLPDEVLGDSNPVFSTTC